MLYLFAAKYIFGTNQLPGMVSKLSGTTKNLTSGLISDPQKVENLIGMVRTFAPLTSPGTVTRVNTYLPLFEKISTLLGLYSFLNRAQTFKPIESLNAKSPTDMMTALMKGGNVPMGKILSQPLIANNMEKIMSTVAMNMMKNGGFNDLLKNENISDIISNFAQNSDSGSSENNVDLNSLMEAFMPMINSMNTKAEEKNDNYKDIDVKDLETYDDYTDKPEFRNESFLPDDEDDEVAIPNLAAQHKENEKNTYDSRDENYNKLENDRYSKHYKNNRYESHEKTINYDEHKANYNEKKENPTPIRIKQRRRR
ncbi:MULTISPECIES: hypothetical protein [unclassified Sedimentibacter]|uniref:hypothetical protein n=1 Tax=unclassified Sedimentibacter TaxID=2649220 RepID=UPI0027DEADD8|nr:hypothetical protein [Sedimentibacter sp. MB35-C1]WMJ78948.1 hypothetical protein RBQ61_08450 [Sedimentibacter sp. MB35-C1]